MKRKLIAVGAAGFVLAALAGCAQPHYSDDTPRTEEPTPPQTSVTETTLPDGSVLTCVTFLRGGGSCDWDHVRTGE